MYRRSWCISCTLLVSRRFVKEERKMNSLRIALIGDFNAAVLAHRAIPAALELAATKTGCTVEPIWVGTASLKPNVSPQLSEFAGIWCVPASPYANTQGALDAIRFAREQGRP